VKMNAEKAEWSERYHTALRKYLGQGSGADLQPAARLGRAAVALRLETLDLARVHMQALAAAMSPDAPSVTRQRTIERAKDFFAEVVGLVERTHSTALKDAVNVVRLTRTLRRRTVEWSSSTRSLKRNILLRQGAEQALKKSDKRHAGVLDELHLLQKHLANLTHTCLATQEDDRQRMSVRLHDEIAQALIAIDLRLLALKKAARANTTNLKKEIARTQRLVKESARRIHQFSHEFGIQHET
jgi:signal transduction histidine kinase